MALIIPDTNIFLQCKPLHELPWSRLTSDSVTLVITDRVLAELDEWKGKGDDRRAKRVRALLPQLRKLLAAGPEGIVILEGPPLVTLVFDNAALPNAPGEDSDLTIIRAAERLLAADSSSTGQLLTRDVLMAVRAKRAGVPTTLIAPEDVEWNANPDRTDPQLSELKAELAELQRKLPIIEFFLETTSGQVSPDQITILQPTLTDYKFGDMVEDRAMQYFQQHPPHPPTKSWDFNESNWSSHLRREDRRLHMELAKRTFGGIARIRMRNISSINAIDIRVEILAEGGWRLASSVPDLHVEIKSPPIYRKPNPNEIPFNPLVMPHIPMSAFPSVDPTLPIWELDEDSKYAGCARLIARVPILRHRDEVCLDFRLGSSAESANESGKLIIKLSAVSLPRADIKTFRLVRINESMSATKFSEFLEQRSELSIKVKR